MNHKLIHILFLVGLLVGAVACGEQDLEGIHPSC